MSDDEYKVSVLTVLAEIKTKLETGEKKLIDHESRLRLMERDHAELKGRAAIIALVVGVVMSIFYVWIGKHW